MELVYLPSWIQWVEIMKLIYHNSDFQAHSVRSPLLLHTESQAVSIAFSVMYSF